LRGNAAISKNILVVRRDPNLAMQGELNFQFEYVPSGWEALERVQSGPVPDLVVLDSFSIKSEALHTLRWLRRVRPGLPVVVLGLGEDVSLRQGALRAGAEDYLFSSTGQDCWALFARRYRQKDSDLFEYCNTSPEMEQVGEDLFFVAASPVMSKLRTQIELLAATSAPVLIIGEPGSGKDLVARLIHRLSLRSGSRLLKIDCSNLPGDLLHRELFGYVSSQGAQEKAGKFELFKYGTLLLDGIANTPASVQATLLERLQKNSDGTAGPRILAACDASISEAISAKQLREDLYYQLSEFTLCVPSLRERMEEIPILLTCFLNQLAKRYGLVAPAITKELREGCQEYSWPGNLRELENFAKRYLATGDHDLAIEELRESAHRAVLGTHFATAGVYGHDGDLDLEGRACGLKWLVQSATGATERNAIVTALSRTQWNRKAAACLLKVSYRSLLYKIERYRLTPPIGPNGAGGQ
jgi:DNA-binding NtrC family response regulator